MARVFEYFVVCGIGPEIRTLDGSKGYHGPEYCYLSSVLDQFPPLNHSLYPPPPPQLSTVSVSLIFFFLFFTKHQKRFSKTLSCFSPFPTVCSSRWRPVLFFRFRFRRPQYIPPDLSDRFNWYFDIYWMFVQIL